MKRFICYLLIISLLFGASSTVYASENSKPKNIVSSKSQSSNIKIYPNGIKINGIYYTKKEFSSLLKTAKKINTVQPASVLAIPAAAGVYFVPGVGQILLTATGVVMIGGITIAGGSWVAKKIISYFKEHTKNKRKSTHNKHTKKRPGRSSEKKKNKKGWRHNKNKRH